MKEHLKNHGDHIANLSRTAILEVDVTRLTNLATTRHQIKSHP
jgi:hypothetical protein